MKNVKIRTLLLGTFLIVAVGLKAQDKYEYARLLESTSGNGITVVYSGDFPVEKIPYDKGSDLIGMYQQFMQVLEKMTDNGWEIIGITDNTPMGTGKFYLKRKKK